jgi:hypothetical protein
MVPGCAAPRSGCPASGTGPATSGGSGGSFDGLRGSSDAGVRARVLAEAEDEDPAVSFEALNSPGMYLAVDAQVCRCWLALALPAFGRGGALVAGGS